MPCNPEFFERELKEYSDGGFVSDTIRHGAWVVDPEAEIPNFRVENAKKAVDGFYRPLVDVALQGDVDAGWAMEPPAEFTGRDDHVHPVTAAPKNSDHPELVRVCHDHSRPVDGSTNDNQRFAHTEWTHTRAIRERVTRGCWMRKLDIQYYYRNFGVRPQNWRYTAFIWPPTGEEGSKVWWDNRLQFGYRNAPEIAMRITCALVWIAHRRGYTGVIGLMDDFAIFAETEAECDRQFEELEKIILEAGLLPHPKGAGESKRSDKAVHRIVIAGIEWDSETMQARLDPKKVAKLRKLIAEAREKPKVTLKELSYRA